MKTSQILILGGGYAGVLMAFRLAGKVGKTAEITLIDAKPYFVERIRLHQLAAQQEVPQRRYEDLFKGKAIRFVQGWVSGIEPNAKTVTLQSSAGEQVLPFDYLAYALGSTTDKSVVPGVAEHAYTVGDEKDAFRLRARLAEIGNITKEVVVVGGGLTGIETVTELAEQYPNLKVRLLTNSMVAAGLSPKGRAYIQDAMAALGITVEENATVSRVHANSIETQRGVIPADVTIWSGSFRVAPLAQQSGIQVNAKGQIMVDETLRSFSHPHIYGIGDAADLSQAIVTPIRMACASAIPMGAFAGSHLIATVKGERAPEAFRFIYAGQCISLGRNNGIMQMVDAYDRPTDQIVTGRMAAFIKEAICRYTVFSLKQERYFPGTLFYPKSADVKPPLQAATMTK